MKNQIVQDTLIKLGNELSNITPYQFIKSSALLLQGIELRDEQHEHVSVQWDIFETVYAHFKDAVIGQVTTTAIEAWFMMTYNNMSIHVSCHFNRTIKTDPYRIPLKFGGESIWVQSMYAYLYDNELNEEYGDVIHTYLSHLQNEITEINHSAWNQDQYDALIRRYGEPDVLARKISENPTWRLHPFLKHMGTVKGKKVIHLLGSNGIKGVALSLLGASVTIVDFSKENALYASGLAAAAEVPLQYIQTDVFSLPVNQVEEADFILMELGVLHYFVDLQPLIKVISSLLKQGGHFLLHEFHPISTKLITSTGKKHKVTGNYFDPELETHQVAFSKHMEGVSVATLAKVSQRKWTIGEIVTAIAKEGLVLKVLEEEPNHKLHDIGLPKTYTILAQKPRE